MTTRRTLLAALGGGALATPGLASASAWQPSRAVQCIVGFAPGGGADLIARAICEAAGPRFTQPLIVNNRPGAGGAIAAQFAAGQPADGHTLFMAGGSETISLPAFRSLPYDPQRDFRAVMRLMRQRMFIVTRANGRFSTLADVVAEAKAKPGMVSYGSSGIGSIIHAGFLVLEREAGIEMLHSPYTGNAPALQAVMAGQIDLVGAHPEEFRGLAEAGLVRVLAVASAERAPQYPDAPTLTELGYDVLIENMKGWVVPAATPDAVVTALHDRFRQSMAGPVWQAFLQRAGDTDGYLSGPDFEAAMRRTLEAVRVVARAS
jgi:tripartite-type tricarboxylate transporter receptor subunit TctC